MIKDLNMDIEFCLQPTVREKDGMAMSSRNRYLSEDERRRARSISQVLFWMRDEIFSGRKDVAKLRQEGLARLKPEIDSMQYLEVIDPDSLETLTRFQPRMVIAVACFVGKTRLIDNVIIQKIK